MRVFYRRLEVDGAEKIPASGPLLLCANHANALADGVILQASCRRLLRPLARSGLFASPLLRPLLTAVQAVPIHRREDTGGDPDRNVDAFLRCYELLERGEALLIFPEGQSHSDPRLRPLKTGAARIALGVKERIGVLPCILPIGLTFTQKGKFRSGVLVEVGDPIAVEEVASEAPEDTVRRLTASIEEGLAQITLNMDSWQDLDLLRRLERFFAFRRGRRPQAHSLSHRFRALQRLIRVHRRLRLHAPESTDSARRKLRRFERLCRLYGVRNYHLSIHYTAPMVAAYALLCLGFAVFVLPLGLWGILNSALPFLLTRHLSRRLARGQDQYDTAKIALGLGLFLLFWGGQTAVVLWFVGTVAAVLYGASLPITAGVAIVLLSERRKILDNIKAFFLFSRRTELQRYLLEKRQEVELELARLARLAKRLPEA